MNKTKSLIAMCFAASLSSVLMLGCGSGDSVDGMVAAANKNNVSRVANCYALFQESHPGYKGPKNLEEFKAFLGKPEFAASLEMMNVDDLEDLFISERDDEEIKVRWNVRGTSRGCYEPVSFETTGVRGVRRVGFANGTFEEVEDETTYNDMLAGKFKPGNARDEAVVPKFDKNGNQLN